MFRITGDPITRRVSPQEATIFVNMPDCPGERKWKPWLLTYLRNRLQGVSLRPLTWATAFCRANGITYRVDGKHSAKVVSEQPDGFTWLVTKQHFDCDTLDDVASLHNQFNVRHGTNTQKDINRGIAAVIPGLADIPKRAIDIAVFGIAYAEREDSYADIFGDERAQRLRSNVEFVLFLNRIFSAKTDDARLLEKGPIGAAMFQTWAIDANEANRFWVETRDGTNPDPKSGSRMLQKLLLTHITMSGNRNGKERMSDHAWYAKALTGWNAWLYGLPTQLKYNGSTPEIKRPPSRG